MLEKEKKENEYKELYLPFYFTWGYMTEELTNEELGLILRALIENYTTRTVPDTLPDKIRIIYKFMLDSAVRTHQGQRELSNRRREAALMRWDKEKSSCKNVSECKSMQNGANECKSMQADAVKENGNINVNENINGNGKEKGKGTESWHYAQNTKKENKEKVRYGDFDPEEAFLNALKRSYGEDTTIPEGLGF